MRSPLIVHSWNHWNSVLFILCAIQILQYSYSRTLVDDTVQQAGTWRKIKKLLHLRNQLKDSYTAFYPGLKREIVWRHSEIPNTEKSAALDERIENLEYQTLLRLNFLLWTNVGIAENDI